MREAWIEACAVADVQPESIFSGEANGSMVAIYVVDGAYCATDNICTHAFALLSDGRVDDYEVECPVHGARFRIDTGEVTQGPAECPLKTYQVRVVGDKIECLI